MRSVREMSQGVKYRVACRVVEGMGVRLREICQIGHILGHRLGQSRSYLRSGLRGGGYLQSARDLSITGMCIHSRQYQTHTGAGMRRVPAVTSTSEITLLSSPAVHGQPVRGMALMREGVVVIVCGSANTRVMPIQHTKTAVKMATIHQTLVPKVVKSVRVCFRFRVFCGSYR